MKLYDKTKYEDYLKEISKWTTDKTQECKSTVPKFDERYNSFWGDYRSKSGMLSSMFNNFSGPKKELMEMGFTSEEDLWGAFVFYEYAESYYNTPKVDSFKPEYLALVAVGYEINKRMNNAFI
jgi:hypothetical protein